MVAPSFIGMLDPSVNLHGRDRRVDDAQAEKGDDWYADRYNRGDCCDEPES
jgi:hypothetical protein